MNSSINHSNTNALTYWQRSGYSAEMVDAACARVNDECMAARVAFSGSGDVSVTLSKRTWERQEGHYPTVARFFEEVAHHPACQGIRGTFMVWLEDGLWEWQQPSSRSAPCLAFGRHIFDTETFLIPDPAFLGSRGYQGDLQEIQTVEAQTDWNKKQPRMFWRGAATGLGIEYDPWIETARGRLTLKANEINDISKLDAKITKVSHLSPAQQEILQGANVVGEPVPFHDFLNYRYLIDADGYCCAWRSLFLKLASKSVVLKMQSVYEQWYFHELHPWKHYLPLRPDLANIDAIYQWLNENDQQAQQIVRDAHTLLERVTYERALEEAALLCREIIACQR